MPTLAEAQRSRKAALREVRRSQRAADSAIERMERRIFALLDRKTIITADDALDLYERYFKPFHALVKETEKNLSWFYDYITSADGFWHGKTQSY